MATISFKFGRKTFKTNSIEAAQKLHRECIAFAADQGRGSRGLRISEHNPTVLQDSAPIGHFSYNSRFHAA